MNIIGENGETGATCCIMSYRPGAVSISYHFNTMDETFVWHFLIMENVFVLYVLHSITGNGSAISVIQSTCSIMIGIIQYKFAFHPATEGNTCLTMEQIIAKKGRNEQIVYL